MNHPHIQEILRKKKPFQFGNYIFRGFELFSQNVGNFVAYSILSVFILFSVAKVPMVGAWSMKYLMFPTLVAGIYLVAHLLRKGERPDFGEHFMGFKHLVRLALAGVAVNVIAGASTIPFFVANDELFTWTYNLKDTADVFDLNVIVESFPGFDSWKLLLLLPSIYFTIVYSWTNLFILFFDLNVWDAMEASRQIISRNGLLYFIFSFTILLIGFGGLAGLLLGVFFTYPAMLCMEYAAFEDLTELHRAEAEEEYVDILVK